jgi:hypothetical protein
VFRTRYCCHGRLISSRRVFYSASYLFGHHGDHYFERVQDYTNALIVVVLLKMNYFRSSAEFNDYLSYYAVDIVINIGSLHFHSCY